MNWQMHHRMQQKIHDINKQIRHSQQRLLTPQQLVKRLSEQINYSSERLYQAQLAILAKIENKLLICIEKIELLSPLKTLKRGYGIVLKNDKKAISSVKQLSPQDDVLIRLEDGSVLATIKKLI